MTRILVPDRLCFTCSGCGLCCRRGFRIWCSREERDRILAHDWGSRHAELRDVPLFREGGGGIYLATDAAGRCRFLDADNRCRIHAECGPETKPLTCRMYPITLQHSMGDVYASLLFSCPSAARGEGAPLARQMPELRRLRKDMDALFPPSESDAVDLLPDCPADASRLARLEEAVDSILARPAPAFLRRILWAGGLLDRLEEGSAERLGPDTFAETLAHHDRRAREEAEHGGIARAELTFFERLLLRQLEGLCCSLAETGLVDERFAVRQTARLRRLAVSLRYLRGRGIVPARGGRVGFDKVNRIRALHLPAGAEAAVVRYLRARIAGRLYLATDETDFPAIPALRATLALAAVVLWHAKVRAALAGREAVAEEDALAAVQLVDHSFGHLGALQAFLGKRAYRIVNRPGWPQRALLYTVLDEPA